MTLARVVTFEGVTKERIDQLKSELERGEPPEDLQVREMVMLHDPDGERSLVVLFFDDEDAYRRGDEILSSMPTGDTPGRRTSVARYDVAMRMTM